MRRFNLVMGFLHLVQGIFMIAISNATTFPIYTNFLRFDTTKARPGPRSRAGLQPALRAGGGRLPAAFRRGPPRPRHLCYKWYVAKLKSGMNPARFYEYALSSSLMIVLIGMLVGVSDLGALILMFGINAMMNLFGLLMEMHNQTTKKTDWTSYIYGCLAGIFPWIVIFLYFYGSLGSSDAKPPAFVYAIVPTIFVFLQHLCCQHGLTV